MTTTKHNHIDLTTLTCVLVLMVLSLAVVYSASSTRQRDTTGSSETIMVNHAGKILLGFAAIFVFANIDYRKYKKYTKTALLLSVALLLLTVVLGVVAKGAARWLRVGPIGLQPSEFAKYALIFHLCVLIVQKGDRVKDFKKGFMPMMFWIGSVTALVFAQPNLSTSAMLIVISLVILIVGRARLSHLVWTFVVPPLVALSVLLTPMLTGTDQALSNRGGSRGEFASKVELKNYQKGRIKNFIDFHTKDVVSPENHQLWQGIIGFGNGGIFGVGMGESKQRDFFLPEPHNDFVFSIVGEEYGLLGTTFILTLFLMIMLRGLRIAKYAEDEFGRLLAVGITASIVLYALINASVTLGMLPTTGLPMPFVSYGGSSMLFSSIAIGVLLNISSQTDLQPRFTLRSLIQRQRKLEPSVGQVF